MDKRQYLDALRERLRGLPEEELKKTLDYYAECIEDRVEAGESETDAVAAMAGVEEAAAQILSTVPLQKIVREKARPSRALRTWEIVLIVIGSPVWLPLLAVCACLLLTAVVVVWSLVIVLVALEISFVAAVAAGAVGAVLYLLQHMAPQALLFAGAGVFCVGIVIFGFFACVAAVRGTAKLCGRLALGVKSMFVGGRRTA
jgi:uncharacterized membrane protein